MHDARLEAISYLAGADQYSNRAEYPNILRRPDIDANVIKPEPRDPDYVPHLCTHGAYLTPSSTPSPYSSFPPSPFKKAQPGVHVCNLYPGRTEPATEARFTVPLERLAAKSF
jgi:hypothetical protein